jgi:hypothetical protein
MEVNAASSADEIIVSIHPKSNIPHIVKVGIGLENVTDLETDDELAWRRELVPNVDRLALVGSLEVAIEADRL